MPPLELLERFQVIGRAIQSAPKAYHPLMAYLASQMYDPEPIWQIVLHHQRGESLAAFLEAEDWAAAWELLPARETGARKRPDDSDLERVEAF